MGKKEDVLDVDEVSRIWDKVVEQSKQFLKSVNKQNKTRYGLSFKDKTHATTQSSR